jgi:hypothetical protein
MLIGILCGIGAAALVVGIVLFFRSLGNLDG